MAAALRLLEGEDESGRTWMVYEGDTAWPLCHALSRIGLKIIALPSRAYRTGMVPELPDYGLGAFDAGAVKDEGLGALYRRLVRLSDCVAWLLKNPVENTYWK